MMCFSVDVILPVGVFTLAVKVIDYDGRSTIQSFATECHIEVKQWSNSSCSNLTEQISDHLNHKQVFSTNGKHLYVLQVLQTVIEYLDQTVGENDHADVNCWMEMFQQVVLVVEAYFGSVGGSLCQTVFGVVCSLLQSFCFYFRCALIFRLSV